MINPIYNLPKINLVGGSSERFLFTLLTLGGYDFDVTSCGASFSLINFTNKNGVPILMREMDVVDGKNGVKNVVSVSLEPDDTFKLYGRYIYQITITDLYNSATEIPGQGLIDIIRNIDHGSFEGSDLIAGNGSYIIDCGTSAINI